MMLLRVATFNVVPERSASRKYTHLGPAAVARLRAYAARHGYGFAGRAPDPAAHPVCWEKFPLILAELDRADWVLWVDSDALPVDLARPIAPFLPDGADLVSQCPAAFFAPIGPGPAPGRATMPVMTGVFALRNTPATRDLLYRALARRERLTPGAPWTGLGDQEALAACLPGTPVRIAYLNDLQAHPAHVGPDTLFVHFFGDRAAPLFPDAAAEAIIARWHAALADAPRLPPGAARYHWACIQNRPSVDGPCRGGPERFLYRPEDLATAP